MVALRVKERWDRRETDHWCGLCGKPSDVAVVCRSIITRRLIAGEHGSTGIRNGARRKSLGILPEPKLGLIHYSFAR